MSPTHELKWSSTRYMIYRISMLKNSEPFNFHFLLTDSRWELDCLLTNLSSTETLSKITLVFKCFQSWPYSMVCTVCIENISFRESNHFPINQWGFGHKTDAGFVHIWVMIVCIILSWIYATKNRASKSSSWRFIRDYPSHQSFRLTKLFSFIF